MATRMGDRTAVAMLMMLVMLSSCCLMAVMGSERRGGEEKVMSPKKKHPLFILGKFKKVVKTDGGEVRVVTGHRWKGDPNPMQVGFIHMEPNTLFIPQYIDANLILFVRCGMVKAGWIHNDELVEKKLRKGDLCVIPAGSAFYLVNTGNAGRLEVVCSMDTSESLGYSHYESFFIGGGTYPTSVLAGFNQKTLSSAFNVTSEVLDRILEHRSDGPIIYINSELTDGSHNLLSSMKQLKQKDLNNKNIGNDDHDSDEEEEVDEEKGGAWTWRKLFDSILGTEDTRQEERKHKAVRWPHAYNLYDREPDFKNNYGWSVAINEHEYHPLRHSDIGVYLVSLKAGSMLAPHLNPKATEYGIVLKGSGTIQVVFPNGSLAMNAEVREGEAFWIPRYFPFCQIASRDGPLQFFGFTTSSRRNRPQFFAGRSSVLRSMRGPELAASFGLNEEQLEKIVDAQDQSVILPYSPQSKEEKEEEPVLVGRKMAA